MGSAFPDIFLASEPGFDCRGHGIGVFGIGVVLRQVAEAHTFLHVDAVADADVGLPEAAPSVEVLGLVLGDELFQFGRLPEESSDRFRFFPMIY